MEMMKLMKQAQDMQAKMQAVQAELESLEVEGAAGGEMVRVRLTAKGELKAITLDPSLLVASDKDILEDLILAAHGDARKKADAIAAEMMKSVTAGMPLPPGFKLPM